MTKINDGGPVLPDAKMSDLARCPFCGGEAWLNDYEAKHSDMPERSRSPQCKSCGCNLGYFPTAAKAITAWNRRADLVSAPSVTVKPLEWEEIHAARSDEDPTTEFTGEFEAECLLGVYSITMGFGSDCYYWGVTTPDGEELGNNFEDPLYAKAAAQADYESRIMSSIQVAPRRATPDALATLKSGEGFATSGAEARWIEDMKAGVYDDPVALRHQIIEATDPDFIWGALDNVHDADTTLDDYAAAVSRAIRAALLTAPPSEGVEP